VEQAFPNSFHSNVPNFGGYIPLLGNQKKTTLSKTVLLSFPLIFSLPNIKSSAKNKHYYDRYSRKSRVEKKNALTETTNTHSYTLPIYSSPTYTIPGNTPTFCFCLTSLICCIYSSYYPNF